MTSFLKWLLITGTVITTFAVHGEKVSAEPKIHTNIVIPHTDDPKLEEKILKRVNDQLRQAGEPPLVRQELDGNTFWIQQVNED